MNKDMENTFNQMAELGGSDERLGTNTTPIINAPLLPMNTSPAATVEGLSERATGLREGNTSTDILAHKLKEAEAIIVAKDARIADLENELSSFRSSFKEQTSLKADNEALTARVARDDAAFQELIKLGKEADTKFEALETQLAAAKTALEPFALISSEGVIRQKTGHVSITTCAEYFHRARAALEAKP